MKSVCLIVLTVFGMVASDRLLRGEEPMDQKQIHRDAWSKYYAAQLPNYEFTFVSKPDSPFQLEPVSLLRWSNPLRPGTHGDLYVWSHDGRGVLIGSIFSYARSGGLRRVAHQFQSLAQETINCDRANGSDFEIPGPGLEFQRIQDAPVPSKSRVNRLVQMRRLSAQFQASCMDKNELQPLRRLSQPVYRFRGDSMEEDGAIFPFVMGTDPELILVLSIQKVGQDAHWHWAAARFASVPLELKHNDRIVWSFDDRSKAIGYVNRHGIDMQPSLPVIPEGSSPRKQ